MSKYLIYAFFLLLGCGSAPQRESASPAAPQHAMRIEPAPYIYDADGYKICSQIANAQQRSAEELADCIELYSYDVAQRIERFNRLFVRE